jgi:hypothetical protein
MHYSDITRIFHTVWEVNLSRRPHIHILIVAAFAMLHLAHTSFCKTNMHTDRVCELLLERPPLQKEGESFARMRSEVSS